MELKDAILKSQISEVFNRAMVGIIEAQESFLPLFAVDEIEKLISPNFSKLLTDFDKIIEMYQDKLSTHAHCIAHLVHLISFWETTIKDPFIIAITKARKNSSVINNNHFRVILFVS